MHGHYSSASRILSQSPPQPHTLSPLPAVSGSSHTRKKTIKFGVVIHMQESPPQKRFFVGCSSPFMRLAQHLTALRGWWKQSLPHRRKPDVLRPSIVECEGLLQGNTTTAMHDLSTHPDTAWHQRPCTPSVSSASCVHSPRPLTSPPFFATTLMAPSTEGHSK